MRWRMERILLLVLGIVLAWGTAVSAAVKIESVTYKGWKEAYRLSNGTVEVIVVPSVARVMRYAFIGGPNALWENEAAAGKPIPLGQWPNTGGDKIWPWPQAEWPQRVGTGWPPPSATDQAPYSAEIVGTDSLRLTSSLVIGYGVRVIRDIKLAPTGTHVHIVSRFVKVSGGTPFPTGVWSITQVPPPDIALLRLVPDTTLASGYKPLSDDPFASVTKEGGFLHAVRPPDKSAKIGVDADVIAVLKGDLLFTLHSMTASEAPFVAGDRAQIYSNPDNSGQVYVELEFTSPLKSLAAGATQSLYVVWELQRLPENKRTLPELQKLLAKPSASGRQRLRLRY